MVTVKQSQDGSAHIVLIILAVLVILGGVGYMFWQNVINKPAKSAATTSSVSPKPSPAVAKPNTIIAVAGTDLNKFINYQQGFEFEFPKVISASTQCSSIDYVYDNYGNKVPSKTHYTTGMGSADTTILTTDTRYVITTANYVVLSDRTYDGEHTIAASCSVKPATLALADFQAALNTGDYVDNTSTREFDVVPAANNSDITAFIKKSVKDDSASINTMSALSGGRQEVTFKYGPTIQTGGFAYKLWYYPSQKKLVFINQGQSVAFTSPTEESKNYDQAIASSFEFATN